MFELDLRCENLAILNIGKQYVSEVICSLAAHFREVTVVNTTPFPVKLWHEKITPHISLSIKHNQEDKVKEWEGNFI